MDQKEAKINDLVARYTYLYGRFGHAARRPAERADFHQAQRELWQIAQAICSLSDPAVQTELDAARRDVMAQIALHIKGVGPVVVAPKRRPRPASWAEFQLTPEVSLNPDLSGVSVTIDVAKRLRAAHKQQVRSVYAVVHKVR